MPSPLNGMILRPLVFGFRMTESAPLPLVPSQAVKIFEG